MSRLLLLIGALTIGAMRLDAQEEWTPPVINFSPGTYTSQTATLAVQVSFSDQSALVSSSRWIKLNNIDVTANFSWEPSGSTLAYANDEITLQLGSNVVEAFICDEWSNCNSNSVTYTYDPATYSVVVTPDDSAAFPRASATRDQKFKIKNTSSTGATFNFTAVCSGSAISGSCTRSPTSLAMNAGDTTTVTVTYTSSGTVSSTGLVKLRAERNTNPAIKDSGTVNVTIGSHQTSAINISAVNPGTMVERDLCLTIAAGPGAAVECGDLRLVHALPTVRTKNKARTPTLFYSSAHAHPFPLVAANVALPTGAAWPDSVVASLWLGATEVSHRRFSGDAWVPGRVSRIVLGFDSLTIPSGLHGYKFKVVNWYGSTQKPDSVTTESLVVVNRKDSPFGAGWWLAGLEQYDSTTKVWVGGDGSVRKYALAVAGKWAASPLDRPDTIYAVGSELERRLPHGVKVRFNAGGQHVKTINRLADTTFFFYSSSRLDSLVLPSGSLRRTYTFVYDGSGKLDSVIAPGTSSSRGVNVTVSSGRLTSIRDPDLASTSFSHDASFTNRVSVLTRPRGGTITFSFDSGSKVSTVQTSVGSGQAYSNLVSSFRPLESRGMASVGDGRAIDTASAYAQINGARTDVSDSTLFWLDKWGTPRKIRNAQGSETVITRAHGTYPALVTKVRLPSTQVLTATYDAHGNIASVVDSATVVNDTVSLTQYTWDQTWDFITKIVPPERDSLTFAYDGSTGNRLWQRDALGDTVHFRYNSAGLLRASDGPLTPPDTVIYDDSLKNVREVRTPLGFKTIFYRDALGRDTLVISPNDSAQQYVMKQRATYDVMDRPLTSKSWSDSLSGGAPSDSLVVTNFYNAEGLLDSLTRQAKPDPESIGLMTTRWKYDLAGRVVLETSPDARKDSTIYDEASNVIRAITRRRDTLKTEYDVLNRPSRRITPQVDYAMWSAGLGQFPWFPNDGSTGYRIPADTATFGYDGAGNLVSARNADARIARVYRTNGTLERETQIIRPVVGWDSTKHVYTIGYAYDRNGRRTILQHDTVLAPPTGNDTTKYEYDGAGRLKRITDPLTRTYSFTYDAESRVDSVMGPFRTRLKYTYDGDSRVATRRDHGDKWVSSGNFMIDTLHRDTIWYDGRGRVRRVRTPVDSTENSYAPLGPLVWAITRVRPGTNYTQQSWTYDALGNIRSLGSVAIANDTAGSGEEYSYVPNSGRIDIAYRNEWMQSYGSAAPRGYSTYDSSGNLIRQTHDQPAPGLSSVVRNNAYYYSASQQLRAVDRRTCSLSDENSNPPFSCLTSAPVDTLWDWYPFHFSLFYYQLPQNPDGAFEEYRYDALGRRVWVRSRQPALMCEPQSECASVVDRTVWDGAERLYDIRYPGAIADSAHWERDTGAVTIGGVAQPHNGLYGRVTYINGGELDRPLAVIRMDYRDNKTGTLRHIGPFTAVIHTDWNGRIDRATLDSATADVVQNGEPTTTGWIPPGGLAGGSLTNNYRTGRWNGSVLTDQQDRSGLLYRRNRYVDPLTGRFTQEDPIGLNGGLNLYGYAASDPTTYSDPFGLFPGDALWQRFTRKLWLTTRLIVQLMKAGTPSSDPRVEDMNKEPPPIEQPAQQPTAKDSTKKKKNQDKKLDVSDAPLLPDHRFVDPTTVPISHPGWLPLMSGRPYVDDGGTLIPLTNGPPFLVPMTAPGVRLPTRFPVRTPIGLPMIGTPVMW